MNWDAVYMIVGLPELGWQPCRVLDVSLWGATVVLWGTVPDERYDREFLIRYERPDVARAVLELRATICACKWGGDASRSTSSS